MRPQAVVVAVAWLAALAVGSADVFPRVYSDPALWARHRQLNDATEAFLELEGEASAKPSLPSAAPHSGDLQVVDKHSPPERRPDFDLQPHNDEASRSGMVSFTVSYRNLACGRKFVARTARGMTGCMHCGRLTVSELIHS